MPRRIGLLGGTFNPIHIGHLVLAEQAREQLRLEEVWFIPVAEPPLKTETELAPAAERLRMVELAVAGQPAFRASDIEVRRGGKSYTIETVRALRAGQGADAAFVFIGGTDIYAQLAQWKAVDELRRLCAFAAAVRPGSAPAGLPAGVETLTMPMLDISASDLRQRIRTGRSTRYLLPDAVRQHIEARRLYQSPAVTPRG